MIAEHMRLVGILGGMGPAATADFLAKVVALTPAETDQEHVPLIVYGVPQIPPRVDAIRDGHDAPLEPMRAGLRVLEAAGVEAIAIVCNTAHFWYDQLAAGCSVPILHIADAVAADLACGRGRVGILATRATIATRIYDERIDALILPDDATQDLTDRTIAAVKRQDGRLARETALQAVDRMSQAGADRIVLACTELPVALPHADPRCFDATAALARAVIATSRGSAPVRAG